MINAELSHVTTLEQFYHEIRTQQEAAHGSDYCEQHDAIKKYLSKYSTYKELGTHQGGTAAAALLTNPKRIELVDISMEKYRKFAKPIFEKYCIDNKIDLIVREVDSTSFMSLGDPVDVMLIDSLHHRKHMEKELTLHQSRVKHNIIFHDTASVPELQQGIEAFCLRQPEWKVVERGLTNVGYTVIERT